MTQKLALDIPIYVKKPEISRPEERAHPEERGSMETRLEGRERPKVVTLSRAAETRFCIGQFGTHEMIDEIDKKIIQLSQG